MSLDREQFWHLYVNANSLCELAIRALGREIDAMTTVAPTASDSSPSPPSDEEIAARLAQDYETLDLSALDGLDWDPLAPSPVATPAAAGTEGIPPEVEGRGDLDVYLNAAYAHESSLRGRVDAAYARADREVLAALLERLPGDHAPLTVRLGAEQMSRWLAVYRADSPPLGELVAKIRALAVAADP